MEAVDTRTPGGANNAREEKIMAEDEKLADTGGIVTTVKEETTKDLDVVAHVAESDDGKGKEEKPPAGEKPAAKIVNDDDLKKQLDSSNAVRRRQDRELRELKAEVEKLKTAKPADEKPAAEPKTRLVKPAKPNPTDFSDAAKFDRAEEKYAEDLAEYTYLTKRSEELRREAEEEQQAEDAEIIDAFNSAAAEYEKAHPEYRDDMANAEVEMSSVMFGMVIEEGPALGHYFALHPDEADAIREITDNPQAKKSERAYRRAERKAVRAIDKIISKLEADAAPTKKPAEETPPKSVKKPSEPVARVAGGGAAAATSDKSKMTFKERETEYARTHPGELNYK